jgi:hypothetical protein
LRAASNFFERQFRWKVVFGILTILSLVDLANSAKHLVWDQPKEIVIQENHPWRAELVAWKETTERNFRAGQANRFASLQDKTDALLPTNAGLLDPVGKTVWANLRFLHPNHSSLFGLADIDGIANFESKDWKEMKTHFSGREDELRRFTSVGLEIATTKDGFVLNKIKDSLPYIYFVSSHSSEKSLADWIRSGVWKDHREVWLEPSQPVKQDLNIMGKLEILEQSAAGLLRVKVNAPGLFALAWQQSFSKHWRAYWRLVYRPIVKINGWSMGVTLGRGNEILEFRYANPWIVWGKILSILGVFLFSTMALGKLGTFTLRDVWNKFKSLIYI